MMLESEFLEVEAVEEAGCSLQLRVKVKPESVKKAYRQAFKRVNKEISIPGFRKGKAPEETIEKHYKADVEKQWRQLVVEEAFDGALALTKIYPYNKNSIKNPRLESCSLETGAVVHISYEHYPKVPDIDFSTIQLPEIVEKAVVDDQIDQVIKEIQIEHARFDEIEGRSSQMGDFVRISLEGLQEEKPMPLVVNRRIEIDEHKLPKWLKEMVLDKKAGEIVESVQNHEKEGALAGLPRHLRLTLHAIEKRELPPLDDELAKKANFDSFEALRMSIIANLQQEALDELQAEKFIALRAALVEKCRFDLPTTVVGNLTELNLKNRLDEIEHVEESEKEAKKLALKNEIKSSVERSLVLHFIFQKLADQWNVEVNEQELNQAIRQEMAKNPFYFGNTQDKEMVRQRVLRLKEHLLEEKILHTVLEQIEKTATKGTT